MRQCCKHQRKTVLNLINSLINYALINNIVISKWYWVFIAQITFSSKPEKTRVFPSFF